MTNRLRGDTFPRVITSHAAHVYGCCPVLLVNPNACFFWGCCRCSDGASVCILCAICNHSNSLVLDKVGSIRWYQLLSAGCWQDMGVSMSILCKMCSNYSSLQPPHSHCLMPGFLKHPSIASLHSLYQCFGHHV